MFLKNLNKYQRIEFVKNLGLNTEDNILIRKDDVIKNNKFIALHDNFSVRTFFDYETNLNTEHYPVVAKNNLISLLKNLQIKGLNIILAVQINPKDAEYAGVCLFLHDKIIFEILHGCVTVRDITRNYKTDTRIILDRYLKEKTDDTQLNWLIYKLENIGLENISVEFSYYKIPVGWKNERLIIWEISEI